MAIVQNNISKVLVLIDKKEILVLFMVFNGDIGMLLILQKMQIIQEKESINWHGLLNKLKETLQADV